MQAVTMEWQNCLALCSLLITAQLLELKHSKWPLQLFRRPIMSHYTSSCTENYKKQYLGKLPLNLCKYGQNTLKPVLLLILLLRLAPAQIQAMELPSYDIAWAESKMKKAALKLEKLDTDLKNYKANSIKESIRRGHDDLGDHYLDYGDLSNALKCYSRARDYCTSSKHVIHMCLNVIKVICFF